MTLGSEAPRPLEGQRILVTRRPEQSSALVEGLKGRGARVLEIATIEIAPPEDVGPLDHALRGLHRFDWIVFTSANAVRAVTERLAALGLGAGGVGRGVQAASVGASTTEAFRRHFPEGEVALQPESEFRAEGLIAAFATRGVSGQRFLLPISDRARDAVAQALEARGAEVHAVVSYRTVTPPGLRERLEAGVRGGIELATFASPSAVLGLLSAAPELAPGLPVAVIGPVTEKAARDAGMDVRVVASPSTAEGLVAAIERHFRDKVRVQRAPWCP